MEHLTIVKTQWEMIMFILGSCSVDGRWTLSRFTSGLLQQHGHKMGIFRAHITVLLHMKTVSDCMKR